MQFFKVKEKTGNFILSQGKIYVFERSCGKVKLHVRCMWLTESINLWVERLTKGGRVEVIIRTRLWNCTFSWSRTFYVCQKKSQGISKTRDCDNHVWDTSDKNQVRKRDIDTIRMWCKTNVSFFSSTNSRKCCKKPKRGSQHLQLTINSFSLWPFSQMTIQPNDLWGES